MKIKIGDSVTITNSHVSGVNVGDKGKVECKKDKGFGIAITKVWPNIVSHVTIKKATTRILYFEQHQFKVE